jgi:hypothetical protein
MMYACGHDSNGERSVEYEQLLPHQRMPMSSGQCPKCVALRNRHFSDLYGEEGKRNEESFYKHVKRDGFCTCPADQLLDKDHWKVCPETRVLVSEPARLIQTDPEILKIARIFLEKYEILSEKDRSAYSQFISCLMNPPMVFNAEDK